jgi:hypothetical protein
MKNLVKEASMGPLRELLMQGKDIGSISQQDRRSITVQVGHKSIELYPMIVLFLLFASYDMYFMIAVNSLRPCGDAFIMT